MTQPLKPHFYIDGYIVGPIWWPSGSECWKDLSYDITREDARYNEPLSLREHVLRASNDGDFQSTSIAQGRLIAVMERHTATGRITRTREFPLSMFPSIADCLHSDPDWFPYSYDDEDQELVA